MIENKELHKFYVDQREEIKTGLVSEEEGTTPEQIFTEMALSLLADAGETENHRVCYDEKVSKRGIEHKINGYSLYENYETLDLFITLYFEGDQIQSVTKTEAETAIDKTLKFFKNAIYNDYINKIEESSQIFDLAHTLAKATEVKDFLTRVNIFLVTNGQVKSDIKISEKVQEYAVFFRVIDINYIFNISEKSRIPIEINFLESGFQESCIVNDSENEDYQSYLAIIPGHILVEIYEQYGARLLEQNVRSFLQFTGKYNRGIRDTILNEPHMFLAFNNGIAATAEEIELIDLPDNKGKGIGRVKDFQIVNGGQTTASIYHTLKKNKAVEISKIFVQLKLTIIKNKDNFDTIVRKISEYSNTQNKVSASDLSSNREHYITLEKLSRTIWAPPAKDQSRRTCWFFERARGQYKNARLREGLTSSKKKAFDLKNPRNQMLTKDNLAKYLNVEEVYKGQKRVIAPHIVVRGSQKNYAYFLKYNSNEKIDNIFFENAVAKAILFRSSEKIYGVKPNALGDMRYITVPYSIGWLHYKLVPLYLDWYKIWKNQELSYVLKDTLRNIMVKVEQFIKDTAPGSLYGEWAKKEECWNQIIKEDFDIDLSVLSDDLENEGSPRRKNMTESDVEYKLIQSDIRLIKSIPLNKWNEINRMGTYIEELTPYLKDRTINIFSTLKQNRELSGQQRTDAIKIIDIIVHKSPELFDENDQTDEDEQNDEYEQANESIVNIDYGIPKQITISLLKEMVEWDVNNTVLSQKERLYVAAFAYESKKLNSFHENYLSRHLQTLVKAGFEIN